MIVVFAAMAAEFRVCSAAVPAGRETNLGGYVAFEGDGVVVCQTGLGRRAREASEAFLGHVSPTVVLSVGTAGGLVRGVDIGHVVFCDRIAHESEPGVVSGAEDLVEKALLTAEKLGLPGKRGASVTVDTVAWTPEAKAILHGDAEPDIVEMESFWIGRAAAARGLPFLAVRAISDGPDHALTEIPDLFDAEGNVTPERILAFTREHPEMIAELAEQHRRGGVALDSISRFLPAFLPVLVATGPSRLRAS
jgi:nucleoside phosphorylase